MESLYIAVDLGAGSGRVFLCDFGAKFSLEEIHRFTYPPREESGRLRWDFQRIFEEIISGLKKAGAAAARSNKKIYSLGVDSWAVDYGLLDAGGKLLADPVCYRDGRTTGAMEKIFAEKIPRAAIFKKTGIQFLNFNTIYQLFSEDAAMLRRAEKFLLLPDLINFFLTGKQFAEYTNATTTQLVNAKSRDWDPELFAVPHLPVEVMAEIIPAGTNLGFLKPDIAAETGLERVRVNATATHDTASAVIGAPLEKGWAYISSGTWSLVGVERTEPLINSEVARYNFTNEGGAYQTIRFLKNVMGLWIFESCRREWERLGVRTVYETLLEEVERVDGFCGFIYPDDERFLNPASMLEAIENQLTETGQTAYKNPVSVTKIILDSLAFRYASVLERIEELSGEKISGVEIVGGGGRNRYLNRMTADAGGRPVKSGLTEATVTGNALVQAISQGRFADLREARKYVAANIAHETFEPRSSPKLNVAREKYREIEDLYTGGFSAGSI